MLLSRKIYCPLISSLNSRTLQTLVSSIIVHCEWPSKLFAASAVSPSIQQGLKLQARARTMHNKKSIRSPASTMAEPPSTRNTWQTRKQCGDVALVSRQPTNYHPPPPLMPLLLLYLPLFYSDFFENFLKSPDWKIIFDEYSGYGESRLQTLGCSCMIEQSRRGLFMRILYD